MDIRVNGEHVTESVDSGQTVGGLLTQLEKHDLVQPEEVILDLEVDGQEWTGFEHRNVMDTTLDGKKKVSIQTGSQSDFVERVLHDADVTVNMLSNACDKVAWAFQEQTAEKANNKLLLVLDTIQQLADCLLAAKKAVNENVREPETPGEIGDLEKSLDSIHRCQKEGCWGELAANLREDVKPSLEELRGLIARLRSRL